MSGQRNTPTPFMRANLSEDVARDNSNQADEIASGRSRSRADYLALKAATRRACEAAGTLNEIRQHTRVDTSLLSRYGLAHAEAFIPLDIALDIDTLAGQPIILRALAELCGFELVPKGERAAGRSTTNLQNHLVPVARELGEVVVELASANIDTPAAASRVEREVADAADALSALAADCRRVRAGER